MATLSNVKPGDLEFLQSLEKRLHHLGKVVYQIGGNQHEGRVDSYTDSKINAREMHRLLKIIERNGFVLYPRNTSMGFAVGFQVANPENDEPMLTFREAQLPRSYSFKRLSEYFMKPENLERAKKIGVEITNDYSRYDY